MKEMNLSTNKPNRVYGIDLGTTYSCVSYFDAGEAHIIKLANGKSTMPSCVMWLGGENFVVGAKAKEHKGENNVAYSFKRMLGGDNIITLEHDGERRDFTPVELSAWVLRGLVEQVSRLHPHIKDVIVTVPARFSNKQIRETRQAAERAGLNVIKMLKEPTSAAIAYGLSDEVSDKEKCLVYDLGGGTFDVSLVEIIKSPDTEDIEQFLKQYDLTLDDADIKPGETVVNVIKTHGDTKLGGDDINRNLYDHAIKELRKQLYDTDRFDPEYLSGMLAMCEKIKELGSVDSSERTYSLPVRTSYINSKGKTVDVDTHIIFSAKELEAATRNVYNRTKNIIEDNLTREELEDIRYLILVGGSTKSDILKRMIKRDFYNLNINDKLDPDLLVCLGAGTEGNNYLDKEGGIRVNDVIPMTIGILADDRVVGVIERYTRIPAVKTRTFKTTEDDQPFIKVELYEGDSVFPEECTWLGTLTVDNIPMGKAGEVMVDIRLIIDIDGLLVCEVAAGEAKATQTFSNILGNIEKKKQTLTRTQKMKVKWERVSDTLRSRGYADEAEELGALLEKLEDVNRDKDVLTAITDFLVEHKKEIGE